MTPGKQSPRPRLGISSCLLGENVRYDGGNKQDPYITEQLSRLFDFVPCCPEVAIGMGIPRLPIRLVERNGEIHAIGIDDPDMDVTAPLRAYGKQVAHTLAGIAGYVFKCNSPSCGITEVKLLTSGDTIELRGQGLFAAEIIRHLPDLPVIDEQQLAETRRRKTFIDCVYAYHEKYLYQ